MTHTLDDLTQLFDFTLDDLAHNRRGMMSSRQMRMLKPPSSRWLTTRRVILVVIVLVLLPGFFAIRLTSPQFTNPQPLFTIMVVITIIGLMICGYAARVLLRGNLGGARARRKDVERGIVAHIAGRVGEDAPVHITDAHGDIHVTHHNLTILSPAITYIVYYAPESSTLLSLEPKMLDAG